MVSTVCPCGPGFVVVALIRPVLSRGVVRQARPLDTDLLADGLPDLTPRKARAISARVVSSRCGRLSKHVGSHRGLRHRPSARRDLDRLGTVVALDGHEPEYRAVTTQLPGAVDLTKHLVTARHPFGRCVRPLASACLRQTRIARGVLMQASGCVGPLSTYQRLRARCMPGCSRPGPRPILNRVLSPRACVAPESGTRRSGGSRRARRSSAGWRGGRVRRSRGARGATSRRS
jgi:hypothetical protein